MAATSEISASVQRAASSSEEVHGNALQVARACSEADSTLKGLVDSAGSLMENSESLRTEASRFVASLRSNDGEESDSEVV